MSGRVIEFGAPWHGPINPLDVLDGAKPYEPDQVIVIAWKAGAEPIFASSTKDAGEVLLRLQQAAHGIVSGRYTK